MSTTTYWSIVAARTRKLDEVVQSGGVRERVATGGLLRRRAREDPLDGDLEHLAGQRPRHLLDLEHLARDVARRAVLADARADGLDEAVVELGALAQHDEERHPRVVALLDVDDERIGDLVEREHRAVDLGRPHADAAAVDRRVRAPADHRRAALGDADPA